VKGKPVATGDRLGPGVARCDRLSQSHTGLFEVPIRPPPKTKETCLEGRHISRCPASGNDGAASPLNTHDPAQYLRLRHSRVWRSRGISLDQQDGLLTVCADAHGPMHNDPVVRRAVEDYVAKVNYRVLDRVHAKDIAVPHRGVHARTSGAKPNSYAVPEEVHEQPFEVRPLTQHGVVTVQTRLQRSMSH